MSVQIIRGNALDLPLADASVDLVVTSPPYFGLRSYQDGGKHYDGQIGAEATPAEFVDALIAATREMVRVVKPSGSIWVNLGDKYSGYMNRPDRDHKEVPEGSISRQQWLASQVKDPSLRYVKNAPDAFGIPYKSLMGIPWRYALRCIDDLGLILRAEVIWSKPNGLPESVTDRVRRSHETWFHFVKHPRYYSAVDEIREPQATADRDGPRRSYPAGSASSMGADGRHQAMTGPFAGLPLNPLGKLPGSVWTVPTQPLTVPPELGVDHFAAFPMEWPRRIIRGWSPPGVCVECGEGRRPVVDSKPMKWRPSARLEAMREQNPDGLRPTSGTMLTPAQHQITGYACACPEPIAPTTPAVVLDPFGGTGTTALVAHALGRHGISVDLSADYCRLAEWRTSDPGQLAAAMQVEKPPEQPHGVDSLLDLLDEETA